MSVKAKTMYFAAAIVMAVISYFVIDEYVQYTVSIDMLNKDREEIVEAYYGHFPERMEKIININNSFVRSDAGLMAAFAARDRGEVAKTADRYYEYLRTFVSKTGTVLNFIEPDGTMFYRAQLPGMYGDNMRVRTMIDRAVTTEKSVKGLELGKHGLYFRSILPVFKGGDILGFVESGVHISFLSHMIESISGMKTIIMLDEDKSGLYERSLEQAGGYREYFNSTGFSFSRFMNEYYENGEHTNLRFGEILYTEVRKFNIIDIEGELIGKFVFFTEKSGMHEWFLNHLKFVLIVAAAGVIMLLIVIRIGFVKSVAELEKKHDDVMREFVLSNATLEERVSHELSLSRQKDQIINQQQKVADMGQMLSAIAHHWRQPINAVGLFIQDIRDAYAGGEVNDRYLEKFEENSMRLLKELSDSIDMFKSYYKPGKAAEEFYVSDVICEIAGILQSKAQASGVDLFLGADCGALNFDFVKLEKVNKCRCEETRTFGPLSEFRQCVMHILFNAIDSVEEKFQLTAKRGTVKVYLESESRELIFRTTDNGMGIPDDIIDKVFNPFFSTKEERKGTGLGLYMAKTVVEKYMGGKITVESSGGETTFEMRLPKV